MLGGKRAKIFLILMFAIAMVYTVAGGAQLTADPVLILLVVAIAAVILITAKKYGGEA